jgi:transforming growth factor-beta-induced protein
MKILNFKNSLFLLAASLFISACDKRSKNEIYPSGFVDNLAEVAQKEGLNTFAAALNAAGMNAELEYLGQYTVLAPTDAALSAVGVTPSTIASINADTLRRILRNHIIGGRTLSSSLLPGPNASYSNLNRELVYTSTFVPPVATQFLGTFFNGKKVVKADVIANNGVIHIIDGALLPSAATLGLAASANPNLSYFAAAFNTSGIILNISVPYTVFAPNNAAFIAAGFPTIASITSTSSATLLPIIRNHLVIASTASAPTYGGRIFSSLFRPATSVISLNGALTLDVSASGVPSVKSVGIATPAAIVFADGLYRSSLAGGASNVIHVIDKVLLP